MQKNHHKNRPARTLLFGSLATLLFAAGVAAIQGGARAAEQTARTFGPVAEGSQDQQGGKGPKRFVPTEKMTADQAVAFPSDI